MKNSNYNNLYRYYVENISAFSAVAQPLLNKDPIDYFSYQRFYLGGKHLIFFTNHEYSKHFFQTTHDLGVPFNKKLKSAQLNKINFDLWPQRPNTPYFEGMYRHHIWNGLTIFVRRENYAEAFYIGTSKDIIDPIELANFYIKNVDFFRGYIEYFRLKAEPIISVDNPQILGQHTGQFILDHFDETCDKNQKLNKHLLWLNNKAIISLTGQEYKCLDSLSKGYTIKYIAKILGLSPRTVEAYLQSIKYKTGLSCTDLLLEWFNRERFLSAIEQEIICR